MPTPDEPEILLASEWKLRCQQLERRLDVIAEGLRGFAANAKDRLTNDECHKLVILLLAANRIDEKQPTPPAFAAVAAVFNNYFGGFIREGIEGFSHANL